MKFTRTEKACITRALNLIREKAPEYGEERINQPEVMGDYLTLFYGDKMDREHFAVSFLTANHKLIATEVLFTGTIDGAAVYPREVVKRVLDHNACAVILSHNHPSGTAEPSGADRRITDRMRETLAMIDVRLLDHMIVTGREKPYSFAQAGLI